MPIQGDFHVEVCDWSNASDREALNAVRQNVFVLEQLVPPELENDGEDPYSAHALARAHDGTPIGTARLTPGGRIGRMAVLRDWRVAFLLPSLAAGMATLITRDKALLRLARHRLVRERFAILTPERMQQTLAQPDEKPT